MSHKDYVKIAGALAEARRHAGNPGTRDAKLAIGLVEGTLVGVLRADNPAFDAARFHAAAIGQPLTGRDRVRV